MDQNEAVQLIHDAIDFAVAGDSARAADSLVTLGANSDDNTMYGACCAVAEAGKFALGKIYGDEMPRSERDGMFVLQELKPGAFDGDPVRAFAARFLVAYCNGDHATTLALFQAALHSEGDQYVGSVAALFADVAGILRLALKQQDGSRDD